MTAARLLELSPYLEASLFLLVVLAGIRAATCYTRGPATQPHALEAGSCAFGLVAVVLLTALLVRLLWADAVEQPRWWFAQTLRGSGGSTGP